MSLEIAREVIDWCRRLAQCSDEPGRTTRTFLSPAMHQVHALLTERMQRLGMAVNIDDAGNIRSVVRGTSSPSRRLYLGSHLDTVPNAGAFDGVLGVVLALSLVETLGRRLPYDLEVIGFSEEEGVRFGLPFIGSRAFIGTLAPEAMERRDPSGHTVADAIRGFGLDPARVGDASTLEQAIGYLEFHIEQGPILDRRGLPLGIVDAIAGQTRMSVLFEGAANHAGTTPMSLRRDALAGAAEWIANVERCGQTTDGLVATVGRIEAHPGAGNVIAGEARASLDVRHANDDVRAAAVAQLIESAQEIARRRALDVAFETHLDQPAVAMNAQLVALLERGVTRSGAAVHHMTSGAGHDAMIVASRMPAAMLFLRSPAGISHHPDESVTEEAVAAALAAGRAFLEEAALVHHG